MKRVFFFALAIVILLCLCACGGDSKAQKEDTLTEDMLIGKTFTTGDYNRQRMGEIDEALYSVTFRNDGVVFIDSAAERDGEWFIDEDRVFIHGYVIDSSSYRYMDGYLVAENSLINGVIPEGDRFDATITFIDNGTNLKVVFNFKKDGTYERKLYDNATGEENATVAGEYIRDGNLITATILDRNGNQQAFYFYYAGGNRLYKNVLLPEQ